MRNKIKNIKLYLINESKFPLLFGTYWVSEFENFKHNLKSVYVNEVANSFDKLKSFVNDIQDLFTNKIVKIKGLKADFIQQKCSTLEFCKDRTAMYE